MSLQIYSIPPSLYCAKIRILLKHKGLAFTEVEPPGGYGSAAYKKIVASGNLPAMIDGELLLADSEAIAEYLNEKHPNPPMLPESLAQRAKIRELSRFHDTRLEPTLRRLFPHISPATRDVAVVQSAALDLQTRLDQLAQLIDESNHGSCLFLSDCGFPITFAWIEELKDPMSLGINWPKPLIYWRALIEKHQAVSDELDAYLPHLRGYVQGQLERS